MKLKNVKFVKIFAEVFFLLWQLEGTMTKQTSNPFYVIVHMANSKQAVDYAMSENANAIETDLRFDDYGNPLKFEHGGFCECVCAPNAPICVHGVNRSCEGPGASEAADEHLEHAASYSSLALIIIDSKVDGIIGSALKAAGNKVVPFIDKHLYQKGYKGNVIISASSVASFDYIKAASEAAKESPNFSKYKFTFDQEGNNYNRVVENLGRVTTQQVFGTGIIVCLPFSYHLGIRQAVAGRDNEEVGMVYIWTLDNDNSMLSYISEGVDGIMTNSPRKLANLASILGLQLANQSSEIPSAKRISPVTERLCDCDHHNGGCVISLPAPPNHACQCEYLGWRLLFWSCRGHVKQCNLNIQECQDPDGSFQSCLLGNGDCGGYE